MLSAALKKVNWYIEGFFGHHLLSGRESIFGRLVPVTIFGYKYQVKKKSGRPIHNNFNGTCNLIIKKDPPLF